MVNKLINNPSMYVFRKGFLSQNIPSYKANYATRSNERWRRPNRRELEAEVLIEIYWDMHAKEKLQVPTDGPLNCVCMGLRPISSEGYHFTKCRLNCNIFRMQSWQNPFCYNFFKINRFKILYKKKWFGVQINTSLHIYILTHILVNTAQSRDAEHIFSRIREF